MKIVSKKIRQSAQGETCSLRVSPQCDYDQTVVGCHLNSNYRGTGLKSPDIWIVYGCAQCHAMLDAGEVDHEDQLRALQETQMKLAEKGHLKVA